MAGRHAGRHLLQTTVWAIIGDPSGIVIGALHLRTNRGCLTTPSAVRTTPM